MLASTSRPLLEIPLPTVAKFDTTPTLIATAAPIAATAPSVAVSTLLPLAVATELLLAWLAMVTSPLFAVVGDGLDELMVALVSDERPAKATTAEPATPPVPPSIDERY